MPEIKKFLVVDDSEITRNTIKNFLRGANIELIFAASGFEGIQKAYQHKPEIVILDLHLQDVDVLKMIKLLKMLDGMSHVKVVVTSENTDKAQIIAAIGAGADKIILKPIQLEVLNKAINDLFGYTILRSPRENEFFLELEKIELRKMLLKSFTTGFIVQEEQIIAMIQMKNDEALYNLMLQIKQTAASLDNQKIIDICADVCYKLQFSEIDWTLVSLKCEQLVNYINSLRKEK